MDDTILIIGNWKKKNALKHGKWANREFKIYIRVYNIIYTTLHIISHIININLKFNTETK